MKRLLQWIWIFAKMQFKKPSAYLLGFLLLGLAVLIQYTDTMNMSRIRVGIYVEQQEEKDSLSERVASRLVSQSGEVEFYLVDSKADLEDEITSKKTECGYILSADLEKLLKEDKMKDSIPVLISPASVMGSTMNEIVFAALIKEYGGEIAADFIEESGWFADISEDDRQLMKSWYLENLEEGKTFQIDYREMSSSEQDFGLKKKPVVITYEACIAILFMILSMCGGLLWYRYDTKGAFATLRKGRRGIAKCACILSVLLAALPFAAAGSVIALDKQVTFYNIMAETGKLVCYILILLVWVYVMISLIPNAVAWLSTFPVWILGTLFLSPALFNMEGMIPAVRYLKWLFPATYYVTI